MTREQRGAKGTQAQAASRLETPGAELRPLDTSEMAQVSGGFVEICRVRGRYPGPGCPIKIGSVPPPALLRPIFRIFSF